MGSQSETAAAIKNLIDTIIDYRLDNIFTAVPCYIVKIHDSLYECKVDVIPALEKLDYDGISTEEPVIYGVPVQFPSSSRSALTFPLQEGDPVLCIFCKSNIDSFKSTKELGTITSPDDYRIYSYRDAVAIPCVWPFSKSVNDQLNRMLPHDPNNLVVAHNLGQDNEIEIRFTDDGIKINAPNSDISVNAVNASINALESVSVTTATASIEAQEISLDAATIDLNGILNINGGLNVIGNVNFNGMTFTPTAISLNGNIALNGVVLVNGVDQSSFNTSHFHNYTVNGTILPSTPPVST